MTETVAVAPSFQPANHLIDLRYLAMGAHRRTQTAQELA